MQNSRGTAVPTNVASLTLEAVCQFVLARLQRAGRPLAGSDKGRHLGTVGIDIADDRGLHMHGVLETSHCVLPARLRVRDQGLVLEIR